MGHAWGIGGGNVRVWHVSFPFAQEITLPTTAKRPRPGGIALLTSMMPTKVEGQNE